MVGPHKRPTYGHRAKTHVRIVCKLELLTISDSTYSDVRPSRTRSLRVHPAFSQVLPQRALARKKLKWGPLCACWIVPCPKGQGTGELTESAFAKISWTFETAKPFSHDDRLTRASHASSKGALRAIPTASASSHTVFLQCYPPFSSPDKPSSSPLFSCRRWQNRLSCQCNDVSLLCRGA